MTKRLVDIDDELLEQVRTALGTTTLKDTVNASLEESALAARRRSFSHENVRRFVKATEDLRDPEVMAKAWE